MSAGFDLSPELLEAISPGVDQDNAQVKFDDAGTLHVLERNADGKLLKDYALKHVEEQITEDTGYSKFDELESKRKDNAEWRFYRRMLYFGTILMLAPCIYLVYVRFQTTLSTIVTLAIMFMCGLSIAVFDLVQLIRKYLR